MSRIFIWLESSSCLNFVSDRDPDEIEQTHMLSWAFYGHICHKFQQGLYQVIWGSTQVDFMLGSELCSRKEHMHTCRLIELPSVSHAAWTYCRTGKSFKRGGGGRVGVSVSYIFKPVVYGKVPWIKIRRCPRVSSCRHVGKNIKYTVALFSALDVSVRKKQTNVRLARFSQHFARNRMTPCVANVHGNFILSRQSDRLIFRNSLSLSLWG